MRLVRLRSTLLPLAAAVALGTAPAAAAPITALYVFGDSLSDVGNVLLGSGGSIPGAPYAAGRFTNGANWADDLAQALQLGPIRPSLAGGTDYAFGGAVTGPAVPQPAPAVPNITQQVGLFTLATGGIAPASALYAVWIGANDIFAALDGLAAARLTVDQAKADLAAAAQTAATAVATLAGEGARQFLVPLIPDLGATPNARDAGLAPIASALTAGYNAALVGAIGGLGGGLDVDYLDTFALIDAAVANPAAFGLTDVTDRCYLGTLAGGGSVCAAPGTTLFWDGQHPTAAGHAQIAAAAAAVLVPEPPAALLLPFALAALLGLRRARRSNHARSPIIPHPACNPGILRQL